MVAGMPNKRPASATPCDDFPRRKRYARWRCSAEQQQQAVERAAQLNDPLRCSRCSALSRRSQPLRRANEAQQSSGCSGQTSGCAPPRQRYRPGVTERAEAAAPFALCSLRFVCAMLSHGSSYPRRLRGIAPLRHAPSEYHALDGMFVTLRSSRVCCSSGSGPAGPKPMIVAPNRVEPPKRADQIRASLWPSAKGCASSCTRNIAPATKRAGRPTK